ncbi:hypothetical protein FQZ97_679560 [compost metagenome]
MPTSSPTRPTSNTTPDITKRRRSWPRTPSGCGPTWLGCGCCWCIPWKNRASARRRRARRTRRSPMGWARPNCARRWPTCGARRPRLPPLRPRPCRRRPRSSRPQSPRRSRRRKPHISGPIRWLPAPTRTTPATITRRPPPEPNAPSAPRQRKATGRCCGSNRWPRSSNTQRPAVRWTARWRWGLPTRPPCAPGSRPSSCRSPRARRQPPPPRAARPPPAPTPPMGKAIIRRRSRWPARPRRRRRATTTTPIC